MCCLFNLNSRVPRGPLRKNSASGLLHAISNNTKAGNLLQIAGNETLNRCCRCPSCSNKITGGTPVERQAIVSAISGWKLKILMLQSKF